MMLSLLCATLLMACTTPMPGAVQATGTQGTATQTAPQTASPAGTTGPAAAVTVADDDYRLGVADKIRILVFDEPSLSGEFMVNANGSVSLPLIGDVPAAGSTATAVGDLIRAKLADGFLREPRVSIDVLTFRPFYILGEVNKPGEYPYSSGLTVLNAVATAEGFTYRANKKRVIIKHAGESFETTEDLGPDLRVRPGDTIRIRERFF